MNITYMREYSQVKVANEGEMTDIVKSFYCNIIGTDADSGVTMPVGFTIELTSPNPNTFVQFADLTPSILDSWVDENVDVNYYKNIILNTINEIINPSLIIKSLPF